MNPRIVEQQEKKLAGRYMEMSLVANATAMLWKGFMQNRHELSNTLGSSLYSLQQYPENYFEEFDPATRFTKWAAAEVENYDHLPKGMERFILPAGLYAVFLYKGSSSEAAGFFRYIFESWLPASGYVLDNRPHFEILGDKYRNESPDSEEEIWIPVRPV